MKRNHPQPARLLARLRDHRGAAALECALGTVALLTVSLVAFELYGLAGDKTTVLHAAVTLADTMSRDDQLWTNVARTLSEFLHREHFSAADAVFQLAAVYRGAGSTARPTVLWTHKAELGPVPGESPVLTSCTGNREINIATRNGQATLPITMSAEELLIVAEVCVEWTGRIMPGRAVFSHYIVPARDDCLARNLGATTSRCSG